VTSEQFSARFDPDEYSDDELIHFWIVDPAEGDEKWVPERLWYRLSNLGRAYETHLLPLIPGRTDSMTLNGQQVNNLIDEIEFLVAIVNDSQIRGLADDLLPLFGEASTRQGLDIEGP
jgi:hypothetical protein